MSGTLPIQLDRASQEPLYRQIEAFVRRAIDGGRLRPGQRLPSVRALAGQLGVGRLTVATAYEQLAADGYLVGRMGFGTIVSPHPPDAASTTPIPARPTASALRMGPARLPSLRMAGLQQPRPADPRRRLGPMPRFDLRAGGNGGNGTAGGPSLTVGPVLERLLREEWRQLSESATAGAIADPAGDPLLRAAIATHLRATRGADCEPSQVVILSGAVIGIGAVARLWLGHDDPPGADRYAGSRRRLVEGHRDRRGPERGRLDGHLCRLQRVDARNAVRPAADAALDAVKSSVDFDVITDAMGEFQKVYVEKTVEVPLYYRAQVDLHGAKVGNFHGNPTQAGPTWNAVDWYIKE